MTALPRILFVDDDLALLDGLKSRLFRQRHRWSMTFETDGERALEASRREPFDVVVSDLRMPGLDGPTLLTSIRHETPMTARILLSGHGDRAAIVRALPAIHQLLSKPCDGATLCAAIEGGVEWAAACGDRSMRARLGGLQWLPAGATVVAELAAQIARGASADRELVAIAERDPAVSAKLLQLASSTYFGIDAGVTSIGHAVARIGAAQIAELVLPAVSDIAVPDALATRARRGAELARQWVGGAAGEIAYAAALLRDCASFGLEPDAEPPSAAIHASLLGLWGVPRVIADTVRWHRDLAHAPVAVRELACAVHVADALASERAIDQAGVEALGLRDRVADWVRRR